jgi:hypothetical protein
MNISGVKQGAFEEVRPNGTVIRGFADHFGADFDMYICNAMEECYLDHDPNIREPWFEPNKIDSRKVKSKFVHLGMRGNRIPSNAKRI